MKTAELEIRLEEQSVEVSLLLPLEDVQDPELSIVVPALNEALTVGEFVDWCRIGLEQAGIVGEILIIDSSEDETAEIAVSRGARVLKTPRRGLGRAYLDAIPYIRGKFVLMGDADCTYDFRDLGAFVEELRRGAEFVMGSRFRGYIEPGAMPALHRYFGTPLTTRILNVLYSSHFSDIHCGMRAMTKDALERMDLRSEGWEYASEMILKAIHLGLRVGECPIKFYKDRNGRVSNVKRGGWTTPWKAGWHSLRVMFTYGADFFLFKPGLLMALLGALASLALSFGPLTFGPIILTLHAQFLAVTATLIGLTATYMAGFARSVYDLRGLERQRWVGRFAYNRSTIISGLLVTFGLALEFLFVRRYLQQRFAISRSDVFFSHLAVTGLLLIAVGFLTFTFSLVLHALAIRLGVGQPRA